MAHSGKNTLMLLDILVQIGLVLLAVYYQNYYSILFVFIGAAWQLASGLYNFLFSRQYKKARKIYLKWSAGILLVFFISFWIFFIGTVLSVKFHMALLVLCYSICLLGGVVLYTAYLCISVAHFVSLKHKGTAHEIC